MTSKRLTIALTVAVAAIGVLVFLPAIRGGWIYDDQLLIADNPYAHSLQSWPRYWVTDFWNVSEEVVRFGARIAYWRPLISTTYGIDWQLGGGSPVMYHVTNFALQALVGALTFTVLRRWIAATWPAFVVSLLFVVHPTKAESVAWISGRTDVLCMIAVLLVAQGIARRLRGAPGGLALEVFGTFIAYTSKEQAIVLPAFAAVEAWVAAGRGAIDVAMVKRIVRVAWPQAAIAIAYFVVRSIVLPIKAVNAPSGINGLDHVQAVLESLGRFFTLAVAPHDLSIQQGLIHIANGQPVRSVPYMILGGVGLIALVLIAWHMRRRAPFLTVGIGFFFVTIAPTSNIVYTQLETLVSERFLYLPFLGISLILGCALTKWEAKKWPLYVVAIPIAIFSAQSLYRSADYGDGQRFWARELELHPNSPVARRAAIINALREKRNKTALVRTLDLMRTDVDYQDLPVAFQVSQLLASLTPDHNRVRLEAIDAFLAELVEAKSPIVTLKTDAVTFSIPTTTRVYKTYLGFYRLRMIVQRALLRTRVGDDNGARELASQAVTECPRCLNVVTFGALVFARTGDYETAMRVLDQARGHVRDDAITQMEAQVEKARSAHAKVEASAEGPTRLQARASELAAVELWGRAFDVLAPYKDEIKTAPKFVKGFAELAYRAGENDVAREMLTGLMSTTQIDQQLETWGETMGWGE